MQVILTNQNGEVINPNQLSKYVSATVAQPGANLTTESGQQIYFVPHMPSRRIVSSQMQKKTADE
jgi:hypothetical protein